MASMQPRSTTPQSRPSRPDAEWWRTAVVYQIYPRSFADSNGDGLGDLAGVTDRVPYLSSLGVDAVWLSPFYPSALADGGYDVDDYRDVDPRLGTLDDFDAMVAGLHAADIRVIVDIVPNHTSNRHVWFREALAARPGSPERARYVFREGRGAHGEQPPSDWQSTFGGPAWERTPDGQWYLHLFAPEQPDLNWDNPEVHQEFLDILRFWSDRGVDGFRVDVAHALVKDLSEPFRSAAELADEEDLILAGAHPLWDRDGLDDIYAEWRSVLNEYDPPRSAVAEAWVPASRRARYANPLGLGQAFNFDLLLAPWEAAAFVSVIRQNLDLAGDAGTPSTWVLSNHDVLRHASRYGLPQPSSSVEEAWLLSNGTEPPLDGEQGLRRARAATLLILALPGSAYLFQGEELGLHEVADLPPDRLQDPVHRRSSGARKGRDGCRVPLPWTADGSSYGFGSNGAHLPQPDWYAARSVEAQELDEASTLQLYRRALAMRRDLQHHGGLEWVESPEGVVHFRRGSWHCVTNMTAAPVALPEGVLRLASGRLDNPTQLPPDTTVWLEHEVG